MPHHPVHYPGPGESRPLQRGNELLGQALRVERQTLRLLQHCGAVLFTIRIHRWPLRRLAAHPDAAARLKAMLESVPPDLQRYKSLPVLGAAVLGYLGKLG